MIAKVIKGTVSYNGEQFKKDEIIAVSIEEGKRLVELGFVVELEKDDFESSEIEDEKFSDEDPEDNESENDEIEIGKVDIPAKKGRVKK